MKITVHYPSGEVDPNVVDEVEKYPEYRNPYGTELYTVEGTVSNDKISVRIQELVPIRGQIFKLKDWSLDGDIQPQEINIVRTVDYSEDVPEEIIKGTIIEAQVYLNSDKSRGVIKSGRIKGWKEVVEKKTPFVEESITISESLTLTRNELHVFETNTLWNNNEIAIRLEITQSDQLTDEKETCLELLNNQKQWTEKVENFFVPTMLEDLNENWLEEGEATWDEKKFRSQLRLESLTVDANGAFAFWYGTGNMYGGHWIVVSGTIEKGPIGIDTPG